MSKIGTENLNSTDTCSSDDDTDDGNCSNEDDKSLTFKTITSGDDVKSSKKSATNKFQIKFQGFKYKSFFRVFPLQQHSFDFIDKRASDDSNEERKHDNTDDDSEGGQHDPTSSSDKEQVESQSLYFLLEERVFASENNWNGKRRYAAANIGRFLHHYWRENNAYCRHYYELIREETPCRLYFDLEYNKLANPDITEAENETLLNEFITELSTELSNTFGVSICRQHVIDLDSSTEKKFSRHLIVHMPGGQLFGDAPTCGIFVKKFVGRIAEEVATGVMEGKCPTLAKYLFVNSERATEESGKDQPKTCFVDTGVYTRNRLFRLLGSSKFGKPSSAALRIASANEFPFPRGFTNDLFYDSESGTTSNSVQVIEDEEEAHWEMFADALVSTFVVPLKKDIVNSQIFPEIHLNSSSHNDITNNLNKINRIKCKRNNATTTGPSSFPMLDDFVNDNLATRKGLNGSIRSWNFDGDNIITYYMKGNRWCENINRSHKSNNIMWNVSISDGAYWQSCLDPECRFRGTIKDLPPDVKDSLNDFLISKAVDVDEDFERALMEINLDKRKEEIDSGTQNDTFEVDDTFNQALMNLNLSDCKASGKEDESSINEDSSKCLGALSSSDSSEKNDSGIITDHVSSRLDENSCESSIQSGTKKEDADESFDSKFASALLTELTKNPLLRI